MIETAEVVADRYGVSLEAEDSSAVLSHHRAWAAIAADRFAGEIVPFEAQS